MKYRIKETKYQNDSLFEVEYYNEHTLEWRLFDMIGAGLTLESCKANLAAVLAKMVPVPRPTIYHDYP